MSELKAKIQKAVTDSMKARDSARTQVLKMALSAIQKKGIDENKDLNDAEVEKVIGTFVKQLNESLDQAKTAKRDDLVKNAEFEMKVVKEFLPKALSPAELDGIVGKIVADLKASNALKEGPAGMGAVMKATMAQVGSRSDGNAVQAAVKKALGI
jgi:uncharacterized protein YqeY